MSRAQTHVLNDIHTSDQKEFGLPFDSQWQMVQWDIHSLRKPGEMLTVAARSLFVAGQFSSCPLAFQSSAVFPTSSLQQTPLQVHAVEREKLSSFLLSLKAAGRTLWMKQLSFRMSCFKLGTYQDKQSQSLPCCQDTGAQGLMDRLVLKAF